jgi:hypothetical protein
MTYGAITARAFEDLLSPEACNHLSSSSPNTLATIAQTTPQTLKSSEHPPTLLDRPYSVIHTYIHQETGYSILTAHKLLDIHHRKSSS